ncbi:chemotaxis protein CheA [Rhodospirillum rubrum]|uniref:Chemotaxis protein CheA n=1 Tax=Rhodospirillum rubrum (strain ATCC 11170 / ATH 1.1.1 / DSM 467 / LMG 4362 / NCIMB 8255 / S1) TaxID=269796 RepID=Q2RRW8_RHORT|nr:chemotaxis protein CheA [Rhodospirillum rubrum]ABC23127.1 CheA Signal Transduction Histidine Kinases (STHK) [Rhodospirillum rubrum ATCC 11170]AEO48857.1 CheA Signal transduction histidine Kinases (STHK) [Rhodospirillum rubrum F11]MBK5954741.1 chemotaxis protein CheA [Rhodospirillum rubrum]QXG79111.1 chemotaxis protein CheA [Rhodospirillum rubrum]HCF19156.1 chemotaxis protein CheA [Rhodospirillum rubrum]
MSTPLLLRFLSEARDLLQTAASGLLALEKTPGDDAALNEVFRSVHTLKGSVGLFDYPAFTKLVHAGEDVLSAVRAGQVALTSELVDLLLDTLDQVGAWVDAIERSGLLPDGAEGLSLALTTSLRATLPREHGAEPTSAPEPTEAPVSIDHLALLPEADRLAAFRAALCGAPLLSLDYAPAEDCFFSGEDPVNLFRQIPDLFSLVIEPRTPWQSVETVDPYCCLLRLRALCGGNKTAIEQLFRYVIEQVTVHTVPAHLLVIPQGERNDGPVYGDFVEEASTHLAKADWPALRRAVGALLDLTARPLFVASALRWLDAVLSVPTPDPGWVEALIAAVAHGNAVVLPPAGTGAASARSSAALSATILSILDGQRVILEMPRDEGLPGRLASVARTVDNVLRAAGHDTAPWTGATAAAGQSGSAAPMLAFLAALFETSETTNETASETASETVGAPPPEGGEALGPVLADQRPANRVLKVDQAKIDTLMALIGELVVSKNSLPFLARRAEEVHGSREMGREIKDTFAVVDRLAQEMQAAIMAVRMLPVSEVFERFPRLVRDIARKLGKHIDLVIEGEDTAADKTIVEMLGDPLLHIIRNSLDHGIESPEEREAAGKPPTARVLVKAFHDSDQVVIEVSDDGRGIDPVKIRAAAVAKGVIEAERAARLSDQEAVNLVFLPGFSTAGQVSDLSGRGVGMDVVVSTMDKANGVVSLSSTPGLGTTVRLSLPLSMAVTRVMMVEAGGGMLFGIPMDHIAQTVRIPRKAVRRIKQSEAFVLRDAIVPLVRLDTLLGLAPPVWFGDESQEDAVLVVRVGNALTGLVVDHFREGMDIILKPFDGILAGLPGYSGTALLGDGRVLLVLNLKELF